MAMQGGAKESYLQVRVTEEENRMIETVSRAYGMNKSQMVIAMANWFAVNLPNLTIEPVMSEEDMRSLPKVYAPVAEAAVEAAVAI